MCKENFRGRHQSCIESMRLFMQMKALPAFQAFAFQGRTLAPYSNCSWHLQVVIPKHGARLLMASKAFWQSIPFKQSVKGVRTKSAREAPTALQMMVIKEGVLVHPTIFVADFLPVGSSAIKLDFQHLQKHKVGSALFLLNVMFWQVHHLHDPSSTCRPAMTAIVC